MNFRSKILSLLLLLIFSCKNTNTEKAELNLDAKKFSGEKYLFILSVNCIEPQNFIQADTIQYFTREKAVEAYFNDEGKKLDEETFYIRNEKVDSIKFMIADTLKIKLKTFDYKDDGHYNSKKMENFKKFCELYNALDQKHFSLLPFRIKLIENKVISIEEIYIP